MHLERKVVERVAELDLGGGVAGGEPGPGAGPGGAGDEDELGGAGGADAVDAGLLEVGGGLGGDAVGLVVDVEDDVGVVFEFARGWSTRF